MVLKARPADRASTCLAGSILAALCLLACVLPSGCASVFPGSATNSIKTIETSPDPNVRFNAYKALASKNVFESNEQRRRAASLMITRLEPSKEPQATRALICRSLGEIGDPVARDVLIRLVRDQDPLLRSEAYKALGKVGVAADATILMQAMSLDNDFNCKVAAIEALGFLKEYDPRTLGYLVDALQDDEPEIRYISLQSLRKLTHADVGATFQEWRAYLEKQGRDRNDQLVKNAAQPPATAPKPPADSAAKPAAVDLPPLPR
jgi:HEAT repeat protein